MAPSLPPPLSRPWPNGISHAYTLFHLRVHIVRSSVYRCIGERWSEQSGIQTIEREKKREEKEKKGEGRKERKSTSRLEIAALGESVDLDVLFAFCEIRFLGKGERERDKLASG